VANGSLGLDGEDVPLRGGRREEVGALGKMGLANVGVGLCPSDGPNEGGLLGGRVTILLSGLQSQRQL